MNLDAPSLALGVREAKCDGPWRARVALTLRQAFATLELAANLVLATG
jgi:hypothetical protein